MKRFLILLFLGVISAHALNGVEQSKIELIYDIYREKHLETISREKQIETLKKIDPALSQYKTRPNITPIGHEIVTYLQHLLCHTQSLLTGDYCKDGYHPASILTTNKKDLTLTQIRNLLIQEHSRRRIDRGIGGLIQSETLNIIAQKYALELCKLGEITHTLNGSTLKKRYEDGQYKYTWGGENLGLGQENIMELLDQLTTSIGHRKNMYQEGFQEIGVGQCDAIWVLNYGTREQS